MLKSEANAERKVSCSIGIPLMAFQLANKGLILVGGASVGELSSALGLFWMHKNRWTTCSQQWWFHLISDSSNKFIQSSTLPSKNLPSVGSEAHKTQVRVEESQRIIVSNFLRPTVDMLYSASALRQALVQKNQMSTNEGTLQIYRQMANAIIWYKCSVWERLRELFSKSTQ